MEVFLQVPSSQRKQSNQTIEFSWGFYFFVLLFLLFYVICASVPTEGTRNDKGCSVICPKIFDAIELFTELRVSLIPLFITFLNPKILDFIFLRK